MTLEERLARRLREWQLEAKKLHQVMEEFHPDDEEKAMLEVETLRLEHCIGQLAADMMARNDPPPKPKPDVSSLDDAVPF